MIKPIWNKLTGKYEVKAFGELHKFTELLDAQDYCNEVNDWWMEEYNYLEEL